MEIVLFFTTSLWISFATSDHHFDPDWNGWIAILFSTLVILWIFIWCHQQFTFTEWNIQKSRDEIGHDFVWTFMVPNDFDDSLYVVTKLLFYGFEWNVSATTGRTVITFDKDSRGLHRMNRSDLRLNSKDSQQHSNLTWSERGQDKDE